MKHYPSNIYQVTAAGGVVTVAAGAPIQNLVLYSGTATLGSGFTVAQSGTFRDGDTIHCFLYLTDLSNGGQTLTLLGEPVISSLYENANLHIVARFSAISGKFQLHLNPEFDSGTSFIITDYIRDRAVTTDKLENDSVTTDKLANITRGSMLIGGAADAPTVRDFKTAGQILIGDGTEPQSVAVSGAFTLNSAGVATLTDGIVTPAKLSFSLESYLYTSLSLTSAQILALNTTPQTIIAAPGSGKWIEVISATTDMNFDTAAYATNTTLQLINDGATIAQLQDTSCLIATVDKVTKFQDVTPATAGQTQIIKNTAVQLKVATGDPTAGSGTLTVHVIYRIVEA